MSHATQPQPPYPDAQDTGQPPAPSAVGRPMFQRAWHRLCLWGEIASSALERAERRIQENFRVPPNGG